MKESVLQFRDALVAQHPSLKRYEGHNELCDYVAFSVLVDFIERVMSSIPHSLPSGKFDCEAFFKEFRTQEVQSACLEFYEEELRFIAETIRTSSDNRDLYPLDIVQLTDKRYCGEVFARVVPLHNSGEMPIYDDWGAWIEILSEHFLFEASIDRLLQSRCADKELVVRAPEKGQFLIRYAAGLHYYPYHHPFDGTNQLDQARLPATPESYKASIHQILVRNPHYRIHIRSPLRVDTHGALSYPFKIRKGEPRVLVEIIPTPMIPPGLLRNRVKEIPVSKLKVLTEETFALEVQGQAYAKYMEYR